MGLALMKGITFRIGVCPIPEFWPALVPLIAGGQLAPEIVFTPSPTAALLAPGPRSRSSLLAGSNTLPLCSASGPHHFSLLFSGELYACHRVASTKP